MVAYCMYKKTSNKSSSAQAAEYYATTYNCNDCWTALQKQQNYSLLQQLPFGINSGADLAAKLQANPYSAVGMICKQAGSECKSSESTGPSGTAKVDTNDIYVSEWQDCKAYNGSCLQERMCVYLDQYGNYVPVPNSEWCRYKSCTSDFSFNPTTKQCEKAAK